MTIPLTAARLISFTPPSVAHARPKIIFDIKVPTYLDRDERGIRMFSLGVRMPSQQQIRAAMISELFVLRADEAKAEEDALFMEAFWQTDQLDAIDLAQHLAQQRERYADMAAAPNLPEPPALEPFTPRTSVRDRARIQTLVAEISAGSELVRGMLADEQAFEPRFKVATAQMHVADVHGLDVALSFHNDALTLEAIEQIRSALAPYSSTAWDELVAHINGLYDLPAVERGNSVSPRGNISRQNGSRTGNGDGVKTGGSSKTRKTTAKARSNSSRTRSGG